MIFRRFALAIGLLLRRRWPRSCRNSPSSTGSGSAAPSTNWRPSSPQFDGEAGDLSLNRDAGHRPAEGQQRRAGAAARRQRRRDRRAQGQARAPAAVFRERRVRCRNMRCWPRISIPASRARPMPISSRPSPSRRRVSSRRRWAGCSAGCSPTSSPCRSGVDGHVVTSPRDRDDTGDRPGRLGAVRLLPRPASGRSASPRRSPDGQRVAERDRTDAEHDRKHHVEQRARDRAAAQQIERLQAEGREGGEAAAEADHDEQPDGSETGNRPCASVSVPKKPMSNDPAMLMAIVPQGSVWLMGPAASPIA